MPDNLAEYEVLIKQYLRSIQEISEKLRGLNEVERYWDMLTRGEFTGSTRGNYEGAHPEPKGEKRGIANSVKQGNYTRKVLTAHVEGLG